MANFFTKWIDNLRQDNKIDLQFGNGSKLGVSGENRISNKSTANNSLYDLLIKYKPNDNAYKTSDAFSNPIARLGAGTDNILNAGTFITEGNITQDYQLLNSLYRDNWIVKQIIDIVPIDIVKKWFKMKSNELTIAQLDKVEHFYRYVDIKQQICRGMKQARLFGGAIGIILLKSQQDLSLPIDYNSITINDFHGLLILDRWQGASPSAELVDNPFDNNFGLPKFYEISDSNIGLRVKVHHSRVIRFIGRELTQFERQKEQYWGASELEVVYNEILKLASASASISSLIFKANLSVMKIKDLEQIFSINSPQAQNRFWNILESISTIENSMGIKLIGTEDSAEYLNYGFNGIVEVYSALQKDVCGATGIPFSKLFAEPPQGMNATGEYDYKNYYDMIDNIRSTQFKDIIVKLLPIMAYSIWGFLPSDLDFEFEEMANITEMEQAAIAQQKSSVIIEAFSANLIPQDVAQKELKDMGKGLDIFTNLLDDDVKREGEPIYAKDLQQMDDPMAGMGDLLGGMGGAEGGNEMPKAPNEEQNIKPSVKENMPSTEDAIIDENDDIANKLTNIKNQLINEKPKPQYETNIQFGNLLDTNDKNVLLNEYDRLNKMHKKISKEYDEATNAMYGYNNQNDIPLSYINSYNVIQNKYNNSLLNLEKIKNKIISLGWNIDLLKRLGEYDDKITEIKEQLSKINYIAKLLQNRQIKYPNIKSTPYKTTDTDNKLELLQLIDELLLLNKKINEYEEHNKKIEQQMATEPILKLV